MCGCYRIQATLIDLDSDIFVYIWYCENIRTNCHKLSFQFVQVLLGPVACVCGFFNHRSRVAIYSPSMLHHLLHFAGNSHSHQEQFYVVYSIKLFMCPFVYTLHYIIDPNGRRQRDSSIRTVIL